MNVLNMPRTPITYSFYSPFQLTPVPLTHYHPYSPATKPPYHPSSPPGPIRGQKPGIATPLSTTPALSYLPRPPDRPVAPLRSYTKSLKFSERLTGELTFPHRCVELDGVFFCVFWSACQQGAVKGRDATELSF